MYRLRAEIAATHHHEGKKAQWWLRNPDWKWFITGCASWQQGGIFHRQTHTYTYFHSCIQTRSHTWNKLIRAVVHVARHSLGAENRRGKTWEWLGCFYKDYVTADITAPLTWCLLCFGLWISRCGLCFLCLERKTFSLVNNKQSNLKAWSMDGVWVT